jgi:hypothetical protein
MRGVPFDWVGVVVGHWYVREPAPAPNKHGERVYRCVSRCGVASPFRAGALAQGATRTCEACRRSLDNAPPPARVVVTEDQLARWYQFFEEETVHEKTNLQKKVAIDAWAEFGRPVIRGVLGATPYGADFGWKYTIRDCHERNSGALTPHVRVRSENEDQRRVEFSVRPVGGPYTFEVDVYVGRRDVPFRDVVAALTAAAVAYDFRTKAKAPARGAAKAAPKEEPKAPPAPVAPEPPAPVAPEPPDRAGRARRGLEQLLRAGAEHEAALKLREEAEAAAAAARAAADPTGRLVADLVEKSAAAARAFVDARAEVARLSDLMTKAKDALDRADAERRDLTAALDRAEAEHRPLAAEAAAKAASLVEAQTYEAEARARAAQVGPLMETLEKLAALSDNG